MAKSYFDRYVWLIDTINRHGHITKKEILSHGPESFREEVKADIARMCKNYGL